NRLLAGDVASKPRIPDLPQLRAQQSHLGVSEDAAFDRIARTTASNDIVESIRLRVVQAIDAYDLVRLLVSNIDYPEPDESCTIDAAVCTLPVGGFAALPSDELLTRELYAAAGGLLR
ncbi:MAG: hypothetical protein ACKO3W_04950, partial [bacterium]